LAYPLPKKSPYSGVGPPAHSPPTTVYLTPTSGEVLLFDALKLEAVNLVEAHRSPLSSIAMNNEGTLLATASDKGTIIRVFSVPQAEKLYQFRRGSIPSTIYNMSFNLNSTLLCVSSATETVHVFRLGGRSQHGKDGAHNADASFQRWRAGSRSGGSTSPTSDAAFSDKPGLEHDHLSSSSSSPPPSTERKHDGTLGSILRRSSQTVGKTFASSVGSYLPTAVTEMWEPARDFAYIKIPKESHSESGAGSSGSPGRPVKSVVAMSSSRPHMMVVTSEGMFYVFGIDMAKGGEGVLLKQYTYVSRYRKDTIPFRLRCVLAGLEGGKRADFFGQIAGLQRPAGAVCPGHRLNHLLLPSPILQYLAHSSTAHSRDIEA
jgi:autophagy-related protein 18